MQFNHFANGNPEQNRRSYYGDTTYSDMENPLGHNENFDPQRNPYTHGKSGRSMYTSMSDRDTPDMAFQNYYLPSDQLHNQYDMPTPIEHYHTHYDQSSQQPLPSSRVRSTRSYSHSHIDNFHESHQGGIPTVSFTPVIPSSLSHQETTNGLTGGYSVASSTTSNTTDFNNNPDILSYHHAHPNSISSTSNQYLPHPAQSGYNSDHSPFPNYTPNNHHRHLHQHGTSVNSSHFPTSVPAYTESSDVYGHSHNRVQLWAKSSLMASSNETTEHDHVYGVTRRGMMDTSLPSTPKEVITGEIERDGEEREREREKGEKGEWMERRNGLEGEQRDFFDMTVIDNKVPSRPQSRLLPQSQQQHQYYQQHTPSTFSPSFPQACHGHQDLDDNHAFSPYPPPTASFQSHHRPFVHHSDYPERDDSGSNITADQLLVYSENPPPMMGIDTIERGNNGYTDTVNQRPFSARLYSGRADEERFYHAPSSAHVTLSSHATLPHSNVPPTPSMLSHASLPTAATTTTVDGIVDMTAVGENNHTNTINDRTSSNQNTTEFSPSLYQYHHQQQQQVYERKEWKYPSRMWAGGESERRSSRMDIARPYSSSASLSIPSYSRHEQNSYDHMMDGHTMDGYDDEEVKNGVKNEHRSDRTPCSPALQRYNSHFPRNVDKQHQSHPSYITYYSDHYHHQHQPHDSEHDQPYEQQYQRTSEDPSHSFFPLYDSFSPPPPPPSSLPPSSQQLQQQLQQQHLKSIPVLHSNQHFDMPSQPLPFSVANSIPMNSLQTSSLSTEVVISMDEMKEKQHGDRGDYEEEYDHEQEKDKEYEFDYGNEHEYNDNNINYHGDDYFDIVKDDVKDDIKDDYDNNRDNNRDNNNTNHPLPQDMVSSTKSKDLPMLVTCSSPPPITNLCSKSSLISIQAVYSSPPQFPQPPPQSSSSLLQSSSSSTLLQSSSSILPQLPSSGQSLLQPLPQQSHYSFGVYSSADNTVMQSTIPPNHHHYQQQQQHSEDFVQPMISPIPEYMYPSTNASTNTAFTPEYPQVFQSQLPSDSHPHYYSQTTRSSHLQTPLPSFIPSPSSSSLMIPLVPSDLMGMLPTTEKPISMAARSRPTSGHSFTHAETMHSHIHSLHPHSLPYQSVSHTESNTILPYIQHPSSSSPPPPPSPSSILLQSSLWIQPLYVNLYQSLPISSLLQQEPLSDAQVKSLVDEAMTEKKQGKLLTARKLFLEVVFSNASSVNAWIEFVRFEMECGEYEIARVLADLANQIHPQNEALLQRRIKIEEKLHNIDGLLYVVSELSQIDSQKALKICAEATLAIMRIGYEKVALEVFRQSFNRQKHVSGNFYLDYLNYELQVTSPMYCLQLIPSALSQFPRFGPLWFACLNLIENCHQLQWDHRNIVSRVVCPFFFDMMEVALKSLTQDILWKALFCRLQFWVRSIMDIYSVPMHEISYTTFTQLMHSLYSFITQDAYRAVSVCVRNLRWRFYLLLSRIACLLGWKQDAFKIIRHGIKLSPPKSTSVVYIEFARCACIAGQQQEALLVLRSACMRFPDEWKTDLELLQQLILDEQYYTALITNLYSLKRHHGAGRLWSTYIYLVHLLFGPQPAYRIFKQALCHVAKSGEVWCEGVRLFLNPTFSRFSLRRAAQALNFAIFFTPQYGDSYIEGLHLYLLLSDSFLLLHSCQSTQQLAMFLVSQPSLFSFINRCSYCEPNYGPMWFSMKENVLSTAKEVRKTTLSFYSF